MQTKWITAAVIAFAFAGAVWFKGMPSPESLSWLVDQGFGPLLSGYRPITSYQGVKNLEGNIMIWKYSALVLIGILAIAGAFFTRLAFRNNEEEIEAS